MGGSEIAEYSIGMEDIKDLVMSEEQEHLAQVQGIITEQLEYINRNLDYQKSQIMEQKRYLWENIYELDPEEIVSNRMSISEEQDSYEFREHEKRLLLRLKNNTYFGRVDFAYDDEDAEALYIGLGGLRSKCGSLPIIYDWRAPISSMYYDFDLGDAYYKAPMGRIDGKILLKRQLKIRKGVLEYAFDSDFKVDDEILQKELSGNSSTKMKNIVATIQKEQNAIVRDQASPIMMVQGVAGSGKTSIALHRIAFLLYHYRKDLQSSDILIISPNNIFADYISNVLPELGEENISEVSFDEIAQHEMRGICKFESKYKQMSYVIDCKDDNDCRLRRIRFKKSYTFLEEIREFSKRLENTLISFKDLKVGDYITAKENLENLFHGMFAAGVLFERLEKIGGRISDCYESEKNVVMSKMTRNEVKDSLYAMAATTDVLTLYKQFIHSLRDKYEELKEDYVDNSFLQYEDVFPIVLLKLLLFGKKTSQFNRIKHVIVDEMQDYAMVQYEILNVLFQCKMTILGDINQVVDRSNDSVLHNIRNVFQQQVTLIKMRKSYRSTYEISEFCRKLCKLNNTVSFERHGEVPVLEECADYADMISKMQERIDQVDLSKITTAVVICKSFEKADKLYAAMEERYREACYLMNSEDADFHEGIIITNSYLVKGLEFEHVIVPEVTSDEFNTERDRQILYIACTRALHKLDILYYGRKSTFLEEAQKALIDGMSA